MGNFSRDIERYKTKGWGARDLWLDPAVWSIACYRLGNWLNVSRPFFYSPTLEGGIVPGEQILRSCDGDADLFPSDDRRGTLYRAYRRGGHPSGGGYRKKLRHCASCDDRSLRHGTERRTDDWRGGLYWNRRDAHWENQSWQPCKNRGQYPRDR